MRGRLWPDTSLDSLPKLIGGLLGRAQAAVGGAPGGKIAQIAAFGEMVAILWADGTQRLRFVSSNCGMTWPGPTLYLFDALTR